MTCYTVICARKEMEWPFLNHSASPWSQHPTQCRLPRDSWSTLRPRAQVSQSISSDEAPKFDVSCQGHRSCPLCNLGMAHEFQVVAQGVDTDSSAARQSDRNGKC